MEEQNRWKSMEAGLTPCPLFDLADSDGHQKGDDTRYAAILTAFCDAAMGTPPRCRTAVSCPLTRWR